jgi:hypothetical protein
MTTRSVRWLVLAGLITLSVEACRHTEVAPPNVAEEPVDTGPHELGSCQPTPGAPGNEKHVGQYCTLHGDQCSHNPKGTATACAIDYDKRGGNYCIQIFCSDSSECGPSACCYGPPGALAKACVPVGCVSDAGVCPK